MQSCNRRMAVARDGTVSLSIVPCLQRDGRVLYSKRGMRFNCLHKSDVLTSGNASTEHIATHRLRFDAALHCIAMM